MRVLVTGMEGFVGTHLAEYLLSRQDVELHGTILGPRPTTELRELGVRVRQADILDTSRIDEIFHDIRPHRVIHLAGQAFVPTAVRDPDGTIRTNILGTVSILEAVRKLVERDVARPAALIVSSGEIYGRVPPERQPITEDEPPAPRNPYAASKAAVDFLAQAYRTTYSLDVIVARPFNHAGSRQNPSFVCSEFGRRFAEIAAGRSEPVLRVGDTSSRRDFTDVRDVVRAYWMLFERSGEESVFNVCSGEAHAVSEIIALYSEISGIEPRVMTDEAKVRPYGAPVLVGSNARLRRATGWSPAISLRATLEEIYRFWRRELDRTP